MKPTAKLFGVCLMICGVYCMLLTTVSGQTFTATLTGTVIDQTGAAVANVKVTATNQGTNLEYKTQTNAAGIYTIPFLPVGNYVISVEATGFKKMVSESIKFEVNQV